MSEGQWSIQSPQTLEIDGVAKLRLGTIGGRFDIVAHQEAVTRIEVSEIEGDPLEVRLHEGVLEIRHGVPEPRWGEAKWGEATWAEAAKIADPSQWLGRRNHWDSGNRVVLSIGLPASTPVTAGTVSGDGLISGMTERTRLAAVSGSVMSDATAGSLHASTVSGEAIIRNHDGALALNSVSGEITASGRFSSIKANTVTGNLSFDVLNVPEKLTTNSVSGNVLIRLPEDVGAALTVTTAAGKITVNDERISVLGVSTRTFGAPGAPVVPIRTVSISGDTAVLSSRRAAADDDGSRPGRPADDGGAEVDE